jgi:hypothetical protein
MCTTSGRWVASLSKKIDFIRAKVEKHFSSSMLPTIYTMANSTNFTYFRNIKESIRNVDTRCHILVKGFKSKGGAIHATAFDFIVSFNMPY